MTLVQIYSRNSFIVIVNIIIIQHYSMLKDKYTLN